MHGHPLSGCLTLKSSLNQLPAMSHPKSPKRKLNGVLLLDKPLNISSNGALQQARRLYQAEKAGHTGVLDPLASGLLPICFGEAAKFAQYLLDADKAYLATLKFGAATSTGDTEGEIVATGRSCIEAAEFQAACTALTGAQRQVPPMFSALKHEGRPLYEYARKGIVIERKPRDIVIRSIRINYFAQTEATIEVVCSKGTYIRTLAEDLAKQLGTFAHLTMLRRTATAGFDIAQAHTLDQLAQLDDTNRDALLLPCEALVQHLPALTVADETVRRLCFGQTAPIPPADISGSLKTDGPLRIHSPQQKFIGLAQYQADSGCLKAVRLMNTADAQTD